MVKIKNDKLIVLKSKYENVRSREVDKLLRYFEEELKLLGIKCNDWLNHFR